MKRKIFLTGATGFVGSNLLAALLESGFEVICLIRSLNGGDPLARLSTALEHSFPDKHHVRRLLEQVTAVAGDITQENLGVKPTDCRTLEKEVSSVFHCAALTDFHSLNAHEQWKCNVQSMRNMLRFFVEGSVVDDFHYISTAYVAGTRDGIVYEDELDRGQEFNNGYEHSKFMAEKILHEYRKYPGAAITIYRPSIIVGHSRTGKTTLFNGMYLFLRLLYVLKKHCREVSSQGKTVIPLRVVGNPHATKNFVPIDYVVRMVMRIFLDPCARGKTYHLINAVPPTLHLIKDVMEEILDIKGIQLVGQKAFSLSQPTRLEQLFANETESYRSYMLKEPVFDETVTRQLRADEGNHASMLLDREALVNLFTYAIDSRWGKRINGKCDAGRKDQIVCAREQHDSSLCSRRR